MTARGGSGLGHTAMRGVVVPPRWEAGRVAGRARCSPPTWISWLSPSFPRALLCSRHSSPSSSPELPPAAVAAIEIHPAPADEIHTVSALKLDLVAAVEFYLTASLLRTSRGCVLVRGRRGPDTRRLGLPLQQHVPGDHSSVWKPSGIVIAGPIPGWENVAKVRTHVMKEKLEKFAQAEYQSLQ
ncbi:hypothetical protein EJB05_34064 [Eragrostis curvula]|uniref:Uncharacterized protein n=1 Tax=Eragrostis curvula TaxID=38414 RepID=A0A5J9U2N8_9POAL|nr:hypothetical protein EJB05_34064 [Eragrostis curvula]